MSGVLQDVWQMLYAWFISLLPPFLALAFLLAVLALCGLAFYAMGVFNLLKRAVDLYLDEHDPKRRARRGI